MAAGIKKIRIGELLLKAKKITEEELQKALKIQENENNHRKLGDILIKEGFVSEEDVINLIADQYKIELINNIQADFKFIQQFNIPIQILEKYGAIPIKTSEKIAKEVTVAFIDPTDIEALNTIQRYIRKPIKLAIALSKDIKTELTQLKNREKADSIIKRMKDELTGKELAKDDDESATMQFIKHIIDLAIQRRASDIHIETDLNKKTEEIIVKIRARVDGSLQPIMTAEHELFGAISARIKLLSDLNISEKRKPQDGRFSMRLNDNSFDFRVSTLPTATGESIVIRILDKRNVTKKLEDIGIDSKNLNKLTKALHAPNGIVLVTGPTGSGKSTTLYAALNRIKAEAEKIITVEDPVEYQMDLINQVNVNEPIGLTFAAALRSILRQDPDIIMVGEIRDQETLEIAIKAALTGHLVISTLHTNDAVSAISRMIDMGADPFMVGAAVVAIEAQRLVKKICPYCKTKEKPRSALLEPIKHILPPNAVFYKGEGCSECNMTGYSGRTLITEVFTLDEEISSLVAKNENIIEIEKLARKKGYEPMFMNGLIKALKGETTLEEVYRVAKVKL